MNTALHLPLAAGQPLFGNQWLALAVILAGVAVLMVAVAAFGRWLAATHPEAPRPAGAPAAVPGRPASSASPTETELAVIVAAVSAAIGPHARVAGVSPIVIRPPSVEVLMLQWSLEGRRQIYSSHKVR